MNLWCVASDLSYARSTARESLLRCTVCTALHLITTVLHTAVLYCTVLLAGLFDVSHGMLPSTFARSGVRLAWRTPSPCNSPGVADKAARHVGAIHYGTKE